MTFTRKAVRFGAAAAVILLTTAMTLVMPASASTGSAGQPVGVEGRIVRMTPVPPSGRVSCWGYYGTFKAGTEVMVVDWATSSDECFGIATDRTIWHTWPNSGGWTPMPGNGHADRIEELTAEDLGTGDRMVAVYVRSNNSIWGQDYNRPAGWTGDWYRLT